MDKPKGFGSIIAPAATVFLASACVMVLELVAGRLVAHSLGASLYTWTAVIGVVLAGITIGYYIGGRIADKFEAKKAIAVLFCLCSASCVVTIVMNNAAGNLTFLWHLSWPVWIFAYVCLLFLVPSALLGMISPVVVKTALERGLATGRTVGDIYAWGAGGSIAGTFLAGYYLIAAMGTIAIIWAVGAILLLTGILYGPRSRPVYLWAAVFAALMVMGMAPAEWAKEKGANLGLRTKADSSILYEDESQYSYIAVRQVSKSPDKREFMQDKLKHSEIVMDDPMDLQYFYTRIFASVTNMLWGNRDRLKVMVIGGGGYAYPRYMEKFWPGSRIDVVEIDPHVTAAAKKAFGLESNTRINTINMDARNYVDGIIERENNGGAELRYDFIYEDALNDYSVPFQLTTREFNAKLARLLTDDGVYVVELIDVFEEGLFLGAFVNTLEQTFGHVYVISEKLSKSHRNTYVVIGAKRQINFDNLAHEKLMQGFNLWVMNGSEIKKLTERTNKIILTDDFAPVENLLAPVVRRSGIDFLCYKYRNRAQTLMLGGKYDESIAVYNKLLSINWIDSLTAYRNIAMMRTQQGRLNDAVETLEEAMKYDAQCEYREDLSDIHLKLGLLLKKLNREKDASEHFTKAISGFENRLALGPEAKIMAWLGIALSEKGRQNEAIKWFEKAVETDKFDVNNYMLLAKTLVLQGRYGEAMQKVQEGSRIMQASKRNEDALKLQRFLEQLSQQN